MGKWSSVSMFYFAACKVIITTGQNYWEENAHTHTNCLKMNSVIKATTSTKGKRFVSRFFSTWKMCYIGSNRLQQLNSIHNYSLFRIDELFDLDSFFMCFLLHRTGKKMKLKIRAEFIFLSDNYTYIKLNVKDRKNRLDIYVMSVINCEKKKSFWTLLSCSEFELSTYFNWQMSHVCTQKHKPPFNRARTHIQKDLNNWSKNWTKWIIDWVTTNGEKIPTTSNNTFDVCRISPAMILLLRLYSSVSLDNCSIITSVITVQHELLTPFGNRVCV